MSLRVLIVEDEPLVRQRLERFCREILGPGAAVFTAPTLSDAESLLSERAMDVLLLDLAVGGEDGFSLLRRLTAAPFHTIVVSAHGDRALEAYELGVLDFVLKPFSRARLAQALARSTGQTRADRPSRVLAVWHRTGVGLVSVDDVWWIEADGDYSALRLANGKRELHEKSLDRLLQVLPSQFVRVHRSYIVNLEFAVRLDVASGSRYSLVMRSGDSIPVGRSRVAELRERFG